MTITATASDRSPISIPRPLLAQKVAVVTGAARGIGYAIAEVLISEGAKVVVCDLEKSHAVEAAAKLAECTGGDARGLAANVVKEADVTALFDDAVEHFGRVDILVNNAGITRDSSLKKMTLADFRAVIDVHLQGTWLCSKAAMAVMKDQGNGGAMVNLSSISGKIGNFGQSNYAAAKAGIVGMTKSIAREGARSNIRVNAIQPGLIDSEMTRAMPPEILAEKTSAVPMQRPGLPEEVAKVALFLASDLSSYCTGITVEVAGGRHM